MCQAADWIRNIFYAGSNFILLNVYAITVKEKIQEMLMALTNILPFDKFYAIQLSFYDIFSLCI